MEELREQITPEIRELVDKEMLVETRLYKWMEQTKKERRLTWSINQNYKLCQKEYVL